MRTFAMFGVLVLFFALPIAIAHAETPAPTEKTVVDVMPYRYGKVISEGLAVYENPGDATPARRYTSVGTWVSIRGRRVVDGQVWYQIDRGGWTPASAVEVREPSAFHGIRVVPGMPMPFGFVIAERLNVRAEPGIAEDNPPISELPRYAVVPILEVLTLPDGKWYKIADQQWVSAKYVRRVAPVVRPDGIGPDERWIAVNLREQTLTAYEGSEMVYATLISSGLPRWQTITGLFRIWIKIKARKMSGGSLEGGDYYYLADVPWTMYFKGGYGLHAAYWHDDFGRPKSHGCVNLSPLDAYWLFQWATPDLSPDQPFLRSTPENPGTWVFVHAGTQPEVVNTSPTAATNGERAGTISWAISSTMELW